MDYYFVLYGLSFIALIITMGAQVFVNSSYKKYSEVRNFRGMTGAEAARVILKANNLSNIDVVSTGGVLTDHYDPKNKVIRLSDNNYSGSSVASIAVAIHEVGHAIQDNEKYAFLKVRAALVPLVNFSSYAGYFAILFGVLFSLLNLIWIGILAEIVILLFQLITLPVEFNASSRALKQIEANSLLDSTELKYGKRVLTAAALTYVAGVAATLLQVIRLLSLFSRRRK